MISFWKKVHFFKILLLDINLGYISNMKNPGGAHLPPVEFLKCYNWQLPYGICNTLWMNQRRIGWYWPMCIWFVRCQWHAIHFCPIQGGIPLHNATLTIHEYRKWNEINLFALKLSLLLTTLSSQIFKICFSTIAN